MLKRSKITLFAHQTWRKNYRKCQLFPAILSGKATDLESVVKVSWIFFGNFSTSSRLNWRGPGIFRFSCQKAHYFQKFLVREGLIGKIFFKKGQVMNFSKNKTVETFWWGNFRKKKMFFSQTSRLDKGKKLQFCVVNVPLVLYPPLASVFLSRKKKH